MTTLTIDRIIKAVPTNYYTMHYTLPHGNTDCAPISAETAFKLLSDWPHSEHTEKESDFPYIHYVFTKDPILNRIK